jgi:hypothetical protein
LANKGPQKGKLETGITQKKTGYEQELKDAQALVAQKQKIVTAQLQEAKNANVILSINKENLKVLEEAEQTKVDLIAKEKILAQQGKQLSQTQKDILDAVNQIIGIKTAVIAANKKEVDSAKNVVKSYDESNKKLEEASNLLDNITKKEEIRKKNLKKFIEDTEELDSLTNSIAANTQKYNDEFKNGIPNVDKVKETLSSVSGILIGLPESQKGLNRQAQATNESYKNFTTSIAYAKKGIADGTLSQAGFNEKIAESYREFDKLISKIDVSTEEGKQLVKIYTEQRDALGKQVDVGKVLVENQKDRIKDILELNSAFAKVTLGLEGQKELSEIIAGRQKEIEANVVSISKIISSIPEEQKEFRKQAEAVADAYVNLENTQISSKKQLLEGKITLEEYNATIKKANDNFIDQKELIDQSTEAGRALVGVFDTVADSTAGFVKAAEDSKNKLDGVNSAMEQLGSSGIPLTNELSGVFKSMANKDLPALKVGLVALGAAMGALAMNYFGAGMQVNIEMANKRIQAQIDLLKQLGENEVEFSPGVVSRKAAIETGKIDIDYKKKSIEAEVDKANVGNKLQRQLQKSRVDNEEEIIKLQNDAAFAGQRAANAFAASMQQGAAQFRAASKTALFGKGIGSVGYSAAQMQLAGIGADKVASAMTAAADATGKMPTAKAASDMAVMAERTGQSVDSIAAINEYFQRTDKVSADVAMNMQEGMRAMADNAGISLGSLMTEVAEASKDALSYQIKSGPALAKQVAYAKSLGVGFGDIAKAGKNMVLNYKDSIKAEMQLSSLLGEQVDLSEVRAKFAEGDTSGALKALQAQGLNPEDMDMFQQEALSQALGGMDLGSLQKIAQNKGAQVGDLKAGDAKGGNQKFLNTKQAAEQQLSSENAAISAQQAILDAKTSQSALESLLNSKEYKDVQKKKIEQDLADQALDASIQKQKIAAINDPKNGIPALEKANADLQAQLTAFVANLQTYNDKIKDAAAQQKQLDIKKGFTENLLPAAGAMIGGVVMKGITNKIGGGSFFGGKGKSFGDKRKMVSGGKGGGGMFGKGGMKKLGKGLLATAAIGLAGWGISKLMGGGDEKPEAQAAEVAEPPTPTVTPGEQVAPGAAIASGDICSCIGNVVAGLKANADLLKEQIYTSEQFSSENEAGLKAAMLSTGLDSLKDKITHIAEEKGLEKIEKVGAKMFAKKAGTEVAETGLKKGGVAIAEKLGINALKTEGAAVVEKIATTSIGKALASAGPKLGASMFGKVASKAAGGGPIGLITGVVGGLADVYGEYKKTQAMQTGDMGALQTGRAASAVGTTLEYAGYGAMIGSIIPGIGTAVGAALGTIIGGIKGVWDNWFSEDAAKMEAQVELQGTLNDINTQMFNTMKESMENQKVFSALSDDEPSWRQAMLEQTVEITRLIDAIAFDILPGIYHETLDDKDTLKSVGRQDYNKAAMVGAKRLGIGAELDARQQNIANVLQQSGGQASGTVKAGGQEMTLADYKTKYNVSDKELAEVMKKVQLNSVAATTKASQAAAAPAAGTPGSPTTTATAPAAGTPAAPKTTAAPTVATPATPAVPPATEATNLLTQQQADARGIIMAGKMDLTNSILTQVSTALANQATTSNQKLYDKLVDVNGNAQRVIARLDKIGISSDKINLGINGTGTPTGKMNLNATAVQLVQVNRNLQSLLDAMLTNNDNSGEINLMIDGKQVSRVIKRRQENSKGDDTGGTGDTNN